MLAAVTRSTKPTADQRKPIGRRHTAELDLQSLVAAAALTVEGKDTAELLRAGLILQGFMQALMDDPAVARVLEVMAVSTGVKAAALEAAAAGWELADRVGLSGPHALFDEVFDDGAPDAGGHAWLHKLTEDDAEAFTRWLRAVDTLDTLLDVEQIAPQVLALVVWGLQLRWSWVVREVVSAYVTRWIATAMHLDVTITRRLDIAIDTPRAFRSRSGETPEGMIARVRRALGVGGGRQPRAESRRQRLADYGAWLYRHKVRGESIRALATEYTRRERGVAQSDDRPTVRYGIRLAERLLNHGQTTLTMRRPLSKGEAARVATLQTMLETLRTPPGELRTPR
jgi:hypothetical protein